MGAKPARVDTPSPLIPSPIHGTCRRLPVSGLQLVCYNLCCVLTHIQQVPYVTLLVYTSSTGIFALIPEALPGVAGSGLLAATSEAPRDPAREKSFLRALIGSHLDLEILKYTRNFPYLRG